MLPFSLTPSTAFYCELPTHQAALNTILFSVRSGEGFVKIIGEVGSGKTLLCRRLLDALALEQQVTAYLPNPEMTPRELRQAIFKEIIPTSGDSVATQEPTLEALTYQLIRLRSDNRRVVVVVDEAQALSNETLEALRLLSNLETESEKLIQIVLLGQPELDEKLSQHRFCQLQQRMAFTYRLEFLTFVEVANYIQHRLKVAGACSNVFSNAGMRKIANLSRGVPRVVNLLCHKSLLVAYGQGLSCVEPSAVKAAAKDSQDVLQSLAKTNRIRRWLRF